MAMEEERKYEVSRSFTLPDLTGCLPDGGRITAREPVILTATYYDTDDLRLARTGASLRFRRAQRSRSGSPASPDEQPWTVKLPAALPGSGQEPAGLASGAAGVRHEISRPGDPDALPAEPDEPPAHPGEPPAELVALVTATTRGAPLSPVVVIQSHRSVYELCDRAGTVLAELADDTVSVREGERVRETFREVEVERVEGDSALLDAVGEMVVGAGAAAAASGDAREPDRSHSGEAREPDQRRFTPKHVRALGAAGSAPPDLPAPEPLASKPRSGDVVTQAIRRSVARMVVHDPLLRLREALPDGDTPVHQLRVGCRRLRSDLRTFDALVDPRWAKPLRRELRWLADLLGAARDAEVLWERLRRTADDPLVPVDASAVARIDAELAARQAGALDALDTALGSDRYTALLDALVEAARRPRLLALAAASAQEVLPGLVSGPWRTFAYGTRGVNGAVDLAPHAPDEEWHAVRVYGKRARYAVDAVAAAVGGAAPQLARRLAAVQDLLGEHQDAAVAGQTWLSIAEADPDDHRLAIAAGRLYERERAAIQRVRERFPALWRAANQRRLVFWLA